MCLVVREIARSPEVQQRIGELVQPIEAIRRIIEHGQETGEFRADLDPAPRGDDLLRRHRRDPHRWVLGQAPGDADGVAAAERTLVDVVCAGFAA